MVRSMAEAGVRGGTSDAFGIVDVSAYVPTSEAAFTVGTSATTLNARYEGQND